MKVYLLCSLFIFSMYSSNLIAKERSRHVLVAKTGSFNLDEATQDASRNFVKESTDVNGIEYEWHLRNGLSIGGELFRFTNQFTQLSNTHNAKTSAYFFNLKYHFNNKRSFQPFIGIGTGFSRISSTSIPHTGVAFQAVTGFTYRFKYVGIYAEYKMFNSKPQQRFGPSTINRINASGKGFLVGVSVLF